MINPMYPSPRYYKLMGLNIYKEFTFTDHWDRVASNPLLSVFNSTLVVFKDHIFFSYFSLVLLRYN